MAKAKQESITCSNVLNRNFKPTIPDQCYSTDITYLYFANGQKAFLSAVKDLATKEIVHYNLLQSLGMELVLDGLKEKLLSLPEKIRKQLIIHSDQGMHYTSFSYQQTLDSLNIKRSMSRKGNCWDNAPIESFFGHLKDEIDLSKVKNFKELKKTIYEYIWNYNNTRYQWNLKKMTPVEYRSYLQKSSSLKYNSVPTDL